MKYAISAAFILSLAILGSEAKASWTVEPIDTSGNGGWSLALDIDSNGAPHAAYYVSGGDMKYSRRDSGGWSQTTLLDNADTFALDQNGDLFFTSVVSPEFYPNFNILLDNNLVLQQRIASHRIGDTVLLDFDSQNRPQLVYTDTNAQQLRHTFWNGTTWTTRTIASDSSFRFGNPNFVATLDGNDQIHAAWSTEADVLKYAKPNGTSWQISTPYPTLNASVYDMDIDSTGNLHLAYDVFTGNTFTGGLHYAKYDGSVWNGGRVSGLDSFGAGRSQVVSDADGNPHLFTYDSTFSGPDQLKHVFKQDGVWTNEIIHSYTSTSSGPEEIEAMMDEHGFHVLFATGNQTIHYAFQAIAAGVQGDADADGDVDGRDFLMWQRNQSVGSLASWQENYGVDPLAMSFAVPEPAGLILVLTGFMTSGCRMRQRSRAF